MRKEGACRRRDPWVLPIEASARRAAEAAKQQLAREGGGNSDHMALVVAFDRWSAARASGMERQFAARNFLSSGTMMMVDGMRSQLLAELTVRTHRALAHPKPYTMAACRVVKLIYNVPSKPHPRP